MALTKRSASKIFQRQPLAGCEEKMAGPNFRQTISVALMAASLALPAGTPRAMDLLSLLNAAVLDWCDTQNGVFRLPHIGAPSCETDEVLYLGSLKGIFGEADAPDAAWWWEIRTGLPLSLSVGVLWYVGPNDPKKLCVASQGKLCQCPTALAALINPAKVPVALIGPGAARSVKWNDDQQLNDRRIPCS